MKKNFYLMVMALTTLLFLGLGSVAQAQEKHMELPCAKLQSGNGFLRGWGTGTSRSAMVARKKARLSAMGELAASLETSIESVTEDYVTEVGTDMDKESRSFFSDKMKASVKKVLKGVVVVCDEWTRDKSTGKFVSYVVVEIPTGEFSKSVAKDVSREISGDNPQEDHADADRDRKDHKERQVKQPNSHPVDVDKLEKMFNDEFFKRYKD